MTVVTGHSLACAASVRRAGGVATPPGTEAMNAGHATRIAPRLPSRQVFRYQNAAVKPQDVAVQPLRRPSSEVSEPPAQRTPQPFRRPTGGCRRGSRCRTPTTDAYTGYAPIFAFRRRLAQNAVYAPLRLRGTEVAEGVEIGRHAASSAACFPRISSACYAPRGRGSGSPAASPERLAFELSRPSPPAAHLFNRHQPHRWSAWRTSRRRSMAFSAGTLPGTR